MPTPSASPQPGPRPAGSNYTYQFNDHGGVDYFRDGTPISNAEYQGGTGADTNSLEQYAKELYTYKTTGQGSSVAENNAAGGQVLGATTASPQVGGDQSTQSLASIAGGNAFSDGGSSSTGDGYQPQLVEYPPGSGYYYDMNNETERGSFFTSRTNDLVAERDKNLADIQQQIADLQTQAKDYVTNWHQQVQGLTGAKGAGDLSRINTFSAASPNAFQSSEGTSYDMANKNYLQGIGDAALQANEAVGSAFAGNPTDASTIGSDTTFGRGFSALNAGINDVGTQYNQQLAGINQQNNPSTDPFRFERAANNIPNPAAVDLSGVTPFVNFTSPAPETSPGAGFTPNTPNAFNANTPLDPFLGGTNLNQPDKDFLRNYLLGKSS